MIKISHWIEGEKEIVLDAIRKKGAAQFTEVVNRKEELPFRMKSNRIEMGDKFNLSYVIDQTNFLNIASVSEYIDIDVDQSDYIEQDLLLDYKSLRKIRKKNVIIRIDILNFDG